MARPSNPLTRRELMKRYGIAALLLHPVLRSMAYATEAPSFAKAPRYVMFFKGGSFYPSRTSPASLTNLAGTPIAPLQAHANDIILFKNMNIHGGSPKSEGYSEEHAAGIIGCTTGDRYRYSEHDAYFAYTDNESIDVKIANHYKDREDLKAVVPLSMLSIGGGAHSDADSKGPGNRFISFRKRTAGDTRYGNAVAPIQDSGQVYKMLVSAAARSCAAVANQPNQVADDVRAASLRQVRFTDSLANLISDSMNHFGMDSENRAKLEGEYEFWRERAKSADRQSQTSPSAPASKLSDCGPAEKFASNGANKYDLDQLSLVHDEMIKLIQFAFRNDVTRVVAFTLSGASSGQTWPSRGIHTPHHKLEHRGDVDALVKIDTYYSEKFAALLQSLKDVKEGDRTALYNSSVLLGMECWSNSSNGHYLKNIPFVFAGQGGGQFQTGQIVDAHGRNNNDIHISCLNAAGLPDTTFGMKSLCQGPIIPLAA